MKNCDTFLIFAQNIDHEYTYPRCMVKSKNKKNNVYPCKPQFYYIKVGLKGCKLHEHVGIMVTSELRNEKRFPHYVNVSVLIMFSHKPVSLQYLS